MSAVAASTAQDFLRELTESGTPVTWKQRQVRGTDPYGQPVVQFNASSIKALIHLLRPMDVRLVEPGFQLQHYLWMHYDPAVNLQELDRVTYPPSGAGSVDYEVRLTVPYQLAGVNIYGQALLRALIMAHPPP